MHHGVVKNPEISSLEIAVTNNEERETLMYN